MTAVSSRGGSNDRLPPARQRVGLPPRPFLYTIDQIGVMLEIPQVKIMNNYGYFAGRSIGAITKHMMVFRNIAPADQKPEWRVTEREFIRWMRTKGFRHYEMGGFSN